MVMVVWDDSRLVCVVAAKVIRASTITVIVLTIMIVMSRLISRHGLARRKVADTGVALLSGNGIRLVIMLFGRRCRRVFLGAIESRTERGDLGIRVGNFQVRGNASRVFA